MYVMRSSEGRIFAGGGRECRRSACGDVSCAAAVLVYRHTVVGTACPAYSEGRVYCAAAVMVDRHAAPAEGTTCPVVDGRRICSA